MLIVTIPDFPVKLNYALDLSHNVVLITTKLNVINRFRNW